MITQAGSSSGSLLIERTKETYKCVWSSSCKEHSEDYIGIGILVDHKLYVSRFIQRDIHKSVMPMGGIGVYKPIGDKRSFAALWAETDNFCSLGSGIVIRKESSEGFEGFFEVRYFLRENEDRFELKIEQAKSKSLYSLKWARKEQTLLHGIGMIVDGQMVFAWGELATEWEVVVLSVEKQEDSCLLNSKRVAQESNLVCEEVFRRNK